MHVYNRANVTLYVEDDTGTPLSAEDIIPILTEEAALSPNPSNPYNLIQIEKGITISYYIMAKGKIYIHYSSFGKSG